MIALALDSETQAEAIRLAEKTAKWVDVFKVSPAHMYSYGHDYITELKSFKKPLFLDLKLYDTPDTVRRLVRKMVKLEVDYLTIHASGGVAMMAAAHRETKGSDLRLIGATVLTSFDEETFGLMSGSTRSIREHVIWMTMKSIECGLWGVVCSPLEEPVIRARFGNKIKTVVPGIRSKYDSKHDQVRTTSDKVYADMIVLGRSVTTKSDPVAAIKRIRAK